MQDMARVLDALWPTNLNSLRSAQPGSSENLFVNA